MIESSAGFWVGIIVAALVMARVEVNGYSTTRAVVTGIVCGWVAAILVGLVIGVLL